MNHVILGVHEEISSMKEQIAAMQTNLQMAKSGIALFSIGFLKQNVTLEWRYQAPAT